MDECCIRNKNRTTDYVQKSTIVLICHLHKLINLIYSNYFLKIVIDCKSPCECVCTTTGYLETGFNLQFEILKEQTEFQHMSHVVAASHLSCWQYGDARCHVRATVGSPRASSV
jgi:hypothetical protein